MQKERSSRQWNPKRGPWNGWVEIKRRERPWWALVGRVLVTELGLQTELGLPALWVSTWLWGLLDMSLHPGSKMIDHQPTRLSCVCSLSIPPHLCPKDNHLSDFYHHRLALLIFELHIWNHTVLFCAWLLLLNKMSMRFIHGVVNVSCSFVFIQCNIPKFYPFSCF